MTSFLAHIFLPFARTRCDRCHAPRIPHRALCRAHTAPRLHAVTRHRALSHASCSHTRTACRLPLTAARCSAWRCRLALPHRACATFSCAAPKRCTASRGYLPPHTRLIPTSLGCHSPVGSATLRLCASPLCTLNKTLFAASRSRNANIGAPLPDLLHATLCCCLLNMPAPAACACLLPRCSFSSHARCAPSFISARRTFFTRHLTRISALSLALPPLPHRLLPLTCLSYLPAASPRSRFSCLAPPFSAISQRSGSRRLIMRAARTRSWFTRLHLACCTIFAAVYISCADANA